jgi:ABC-2 type transport system ATP-binding protein
MPPEPLITLESVTCQFGSVVAVRDLTLFVASGELVGFIGPSGSGKTTTVRMLCGILAPTSGTVRVFSKDPVLFGPADRARVGYLPQHFLLYPNLSVMANLSFMAGLYGMGLRLRGRRMREVLELVELWPDRGKQAAELSGGMQRRLALAATLLHDPELLFLDEPTTGQDPILRRKIWDWLRGLGREGHTLFVTTHYVGDAELCDRVALMDRGSLVAFNTPAKLRRMAYNGDLMELIVPRDIFAYLRSLERMRQVRGLEVREPDRLSVVVDDAGKALAEITETLRAQELAPVSIREASPSFDDVFERLIRRHQRQVQT